MKHSKTEPDENMDWQKVLTALEIHARLPKGMKLTLTDIWDTERHTHCARFLLTTGSYEETETITATDISGLLAQLTVEYGTRFMRQHRLTQDTVNDDAETE